MSLDSIEQKAKTIIEAAYKLGQNKNRKEQDETKQYIITIAASIAQEVDEEKKQIKK